MPCHAPTVVDVIRDAIGVDTLGHRNVTQAVRDQRCARKIIESVNVWARTSRPPEVPADELCPYVHLPCTEVYGDMGRIWFELMIGRRQDPTDLLNLCRHHLLYCHHLAFPFHSIQEAELAQVVAVLAAIEKLVDQRVLFLMPPRSNIDAEQAVDGSFVRVVTMLNSYDEAAIARDPLGPLDEASTRLVLSDQDTTGWPEDDSDLAWEVWERNLRWRAAVSEARSALVEPAGFGHLVDSYFAAPAVATAFKCLVEELGFEWQSASMREFVLSRGY
jgi:hypothetical protein